MLHGKPFLVAPLLFSSAQLRRSSHSAVKLSVPRRWSGSRRSSCLPVLCAPRMFLRNCYSTNQHPASTGSRSQGPPPHRISARSNINLLYPYTQYSNLPFQGELLLPYISFPGGAFCPVYPLPVPVPATSLAAVTFHQSVLFPQYFLQYSVVNSHFLWKLFFWHKHPGSLLDVYTARFSQSLVLERHDFVIIPRFFGISVPIPSSLVATLVLAYIFALIAASRFGLRGSVGI